MLQFTLLQWGILFLSILLSISMVNTVRTRTKTLMKRSIITFIFSFLAVIFLSQGYSQGAEINNGNMAIQPVFKTNPLNSRFKNENNKIGDIESSEANLLNNADQHRTINKDSLNLTLSERVARAYGLNEFPKVKSISYTFNVKFNGKLFHRSWKWFPKTNEITYWGKDSTGKEIKFTYNRDKKMDAKTKKIDAAFINDNYWLLFPFHLVWDNHVDIKDVGMKNYPIGKGKGNCLVVKYLGNYGYTPGDVFELYLNKNYTIHQWIYRHGGSKKNPRPATWQGNKKFGKIIISTEHYGPHKKFRLWFSNVKVQY